MILVNVLLVAVGLLAGFFIGVNITKRGVRIFKSIEVDLLHGEVRVHLIERGIPGVLTMPLHKHSTSPPAQEGTT